MTYLLILLGMFLLFLGLYYLGVVLDFMEGSYNYHGKGIKALKLDLIPFYSIYRTAKNKYNDLKETEQRQP